MTHLTIATRGSKLALWQAAHVKARILEICPDIAGVTLLVLKTRGDKILDVPLAKVGGKGLFVKEIEEALLDGRADLAVHSMKDVPMDLPAGLRLGVILDREDARDIFLSASHEDIDSLPSGARVGTSSLRRQSQLLAIRPDLTIVPLRGNVDTRLGKLMSGEFDAIIMAAAGMNRLQLTAPYMVPLSLARLLPAAGQGALGLEYSACDPKLHARLAFLDHGDTHRCVMAERGFLAGLEGGCQTPIAAHAVIAEGKLNLETLIMDTQGQRAIRDKGSLPPSATPEEAHAMGLSVAKRVKRSGGAALMAELLARAEEP